MKSALPFGAIVVGIALLALGLAWSTLFPVAAGWTPEKSEQLSNLGSEANKLKFEIIKAKQSPSMHAGKNPAELQTNYNKIVEQYNVLDIEFKMIRDKPASTGSALKWIGIIITAAGAVFMFLNKQEA